MYANMLSLADTAYDKAQLYGVWDRAIKQYIPKCAGYRGVTHAYHHLGLSDGLYVCVAW